MKGTGVANGAERPTDGNSEGQNRSTYVPIIPRNDWTVGIDLPAKRVRSALSLKGPFSQPQQRGGKPPSLKESLLPRASRE